ncbi:MAG TPA: acyl-CoA dehydrogenase, partial [bacterium]|nr:acyl-CoA dehydrogenase [bacterium]
MDAKGVSAPVAGGSFLIRETKPGDAFAPEAFTAEHRLIAQTARDFAEREIIPNLDRIEQKDWAL